MSPHGAVSGVSFETDEETSLVLSSLDEFIEQEVKPLEADLGERWSNPRKRHEDDGRFVPDVLEAIETVRKKSAEAGFYAMNLPPEVGGDGVSNVTWYRAMRHVASNGPGLTEHVLAGPEGPKPLLAQAEGEQAERYLKPCVRGEKSTAFAQTEPGAGSDSPNMETTAEKDGDEWVLDGRKQWITNGPYADFVQVFARTTPQEELGRYGGITCFLVEDDEYEVSTLNNAVGMVGMQAELVFDAVRLPENRVLGTVDGAFYDAMEFLSLGRLEIGARALGHAEFLLDRGVEYAGDREAFGRPIGAFQGISHTLARGRARTFAADAAGLRLAWLLDRGEQAIEESSIVKYLATNVLFDVADGVVGVHGGNGVAEDNPFMNELQTARILRIVEGTDEIQLNTIAKELGVR
ncbi:acyl-CoA dehydrogenase [Natronomonas pharaonis DSM 2160]|uniref:Acyl-CoA dehydrogenase n=1 Tax=Natronomonas pharaonis (strain ATCC 35678 / DSM 2160 / CIP 103997 / JCM 8858 / NBRC 14720 / NCIMB 2260 / Gabara) TaxID=348780 RepID=A0A1U7EY90_NATPD|nr:acyl-CoA dehydrogenase family protein [Natronomonas pharaonis]CAI50198.2 acyl-CoA dehydrogenase [Natronomonas pharaonis DSM 2160]